MIGNRVLYCVGLFLGFTTAARFPVFLITALLSIAVMPILYPAFQAVGKIGGESWKE